MSLTDRFLNAITMYKVVLYGLIVLVANAVVLGFLGVLFYTGWQLLISLLVLLITCYVSNYLFAKTLKAPTNVESTAITALILFFVVAPVASYAEVWLMILVALLAIASKYLLAIRKKHIFNPVAIALLIVGLAGIGTAIWWIATPSMLPMAALVGLLIVRKVRRFSMFSAFMVTSLIILVTLGMLSGVSFFEVLRSAFMSWPLIFFATVMLTEPQTSPYSQRLQILYGVLVGILFSSQFHIGPLYSTPELALVVGNLFAYIVNSKQKLILHLQAKQQLSPSVHGFSFSTDQQLKFEPGQYMEWTLAHKHPDDRGNRRYFTVASSPTESQVQLGVRTFPQGSSFKEALQDMKVGDTMVVSQLSGEFTLPKDIKKKLVFIAGGIGITPFRSMLKYLIDTQQKRNIVLMYACASEDDFVYRDIFDQAQRELGIRVHYIVTETQKASPSWSGKKGYITKEMITQEIPDYLERTFYLSGPGAMVDAYRKLLRSMKVAHKNIKTDYFPGF